MADGDGRVIECDRADARTVSREEVVRRLHARRVLFDVSGEQSREAALALLRELDPGLAADVEAAMAAERRSGRGRSPRLAVTF